MRTSDADIIIVPGHGNSGPEHWQTRWEQKLGSARRVAQGSWTKPDFTDWQDNVVRAAEAATRPAILVAHSLGVITVVHAAKRLAGTKVKGAFLVAPPGETYMVEHEEIDLKFADVPRDPLPFPAVWSPRATIPTAPISRRRNGPMPGGPRSPTPVRAGTSTPIPATGPGPRG